jgi:hypothetical protein
VAGVASASPLHKGARVLSFQNGRQVDSSVRTVRCDANLISNGKPADKTKTSQFSFETAVLSAAFSFETYSEPVNSRWERGSKGCDVAFKSDKFTRSLYCGIVEVTVLEAEELPEEDDNAEKVHSVFLLIYIP